MTQTLAQGVAQDAPGALCRVCLAPLTRPFIDLGSMPLANGLLAAPASPDPKYPLRVRVCDRCLLVQADPIVAPEDLFSNYPFQSSMSAPWLAHCADYAAAMTDRFGLTADSQVIEVASNDGCLLAAFDGPKVVGVDPARNIAAHALVPTYIEFFTADLAHRLPRADLVVANNVLGHVPDLNDFVAGLATLLKRDGVLTIEVPWLLDLIEGCQFDTIYHEHFSYFSLHALEHVLDRHGLHVFDVEHLGVHGGSLRVFVSRERRAGRMVDEFRYREEQFGLTDPASPCYAEFAPAAETCITALRSFFDHHDHVAGAGAPAKGNTLLNAAGVRFPALEFVTDVSPHKQGRFLPGSHVPVRAPEWMAERRPEFVLVLAWNWYDEIVRRFPDWGQTFVHPLRLL